MGSHFSFYIFYRFKSQPTPSTVVVDQGLALHFFMENHEFDGMELKDFRELDIIMVLE